MADQSFLKTALAKRELSDLERLAITGEPPDTKLERVASDLPSERSSNDEIRRMIHPDVAYVRRVKARAEDDIAAYIGKDIAIVAVSTGLFGIVALALGAGSVGAASWAILGLIVTVVATIIVHWLLAVSGIDKDLRRQFGETFTQLEDEKAKNAKPDIKVEILEVYDTFTFPLGCFSANGLPSGQRPEADSAESTPVDCLFTIKARVCNVHPVPTSLTFELWVQSPNANCKAQRSSLADVLFQHDIHTTSGNRVSKLQTVIEEMQDLEMVCETPPATGRWQPGWLRFVLKKADNPIRRDIQAITLVIRDVYGGTTLITSQRSEWHTSGAFLSKREEEIRKARERVTDKAFGG